MEPETDLEQKIRRLTKLIGSDPGFYMLALHSFIEFYLRDIKKLGAEPSFPRLTWAFREELLEKYGHTFIEGLSSLGQLGRQHILTNRVRHAFVELSPEEARSATQLFIRFCRLAGIHDGDQLELFYRHLDIWKKKESFLEQDIIIRTLQSELALLQRENSDLMSNITAFRDLQERNRRVSLELEQKTRELEDVRRRGDARAERIQKLRQERHVLREEKNRLLREKEDYRRLETYLDYLGRMTVYTRSRIDYERIIAETTPEQKDIINSISFHRDWLIRGGAGTGKSLVLLELMKEAARQGRFDFFSEAPLLFVTFTKTLVKYGRYTSKLMNFDLPGELYSTADTVVFEQLQKIEKPFGYDFTIFEKFLATGHLPGFLTQEELKTELEEYLLGRLITEEEYLQDLISREGMRRPLNPEQRKIVWQIFNAYTSYMEHERLFSIHYGRVKLFRFLERHPETQQVTRYGTLFIDEVQDLNAACLSALKKLTTGSIIMAGDFEQSLYQIQRPFARAGIDIRGTTRILKTNFRNTRQIYTLAERFKNRSLKEDTIKGPQTQTFREGPEPELFIQKDSAALRELLYQRVVLFTRDLGYDIDTICILTYHNREIDNLLDFFAERGIEGTKVNTDSFEFSRGGTLNLSTLHSCKGIDFPVVFLYLPEVVRLPSYSAEEAEGLLRNLVYVGVTRAMDHLDVLIPDEDDPVLHDLAACVRHD